MNIEHDRTYWRAQTARRLVDEAKHYPTVELCIALGERLDDMASIAEEADDWKQRFELAAAANASLRAELAAVELELDHVLGGLDQ